MPLTASEAQNVLSEARKLIGVQYDILPCNMFVWEAFKNAGLEYPAKNTRTFDKLVNPDLGYFEEIKFVNGTQDLQAGDVLLFPGHMGIWDPYGCKALGTNPECKRLDNKAPFLSSRWAGNRGPDFGQTSWFGKQYRVFRWKGKPAR